MDSRGTMAMVQRKRFEKAVLMEKLKRGDLVMVHDGAASRDCRLGWVVEKNAWDTTHGRIAEENERWLIYFGFENEWWYKRKSLKKIA